MSARKQCFFVNNEEVLLILNRIPHGLKSRFVETAILEFTKNADKSILELFGILKTDDSKDNATEKKKSTQEPAYSESIYKSMTIK